MPNENIPNPKKEQEKIEVYCVVCNKESKVQSVNERCPHCGTRTLLAGKKPNYNI